MRVNIPAGPDISTPRSVILTTPNRDGISDVYLGEPAKDLGSRTNGQIAGDIAGRISDPTRAMKVATVDTLKNEIQFSLTPGDIITEKAIIADVRASLTNSRRRR